MLDSHIMLLGQRVATYSLVFGATLLILLIGWVWRAPHGRRWHALDVALGALAGGLVLGRVAHVVLWWAYFRDHTTEIVHIQAGGLEGPGVVAGALLGGALAGRWRRWSFSPAWPYLAWCVLGLTLAGWLGCWASLCAYGAEVPDPARAPGWAWWLAMDVYGISAPRWAVQALGLGASFLLMPLVALAQRVPSLRWRTFGLSLSGVALIGFLLGFWRGDYAPLWLGLRLDQVFDAVVCGWGLALSWRLPRLV